MIDSLWAAARDSLPSGSRLEMEDIEGRVRVVGWDERGEMLRLRYGSSPDEALRSFAADDPRTRSAAAA